MVYLLILLGLAVVVAPLMSAMPSKAQRAKAGLRDLARAHDLRVSLRSRLRCPHGFGLSRRTSWRAMSGVSLFTAEVWGRHYLCVDGRWSPTTGVRMPPGGCSSCPWCGLRRVQNESVSIFWDEKAGPRGWLKSAKLLI